MKKRITEFDFIRALCSIGIIAYHFSVHLVEGAFIPFAYHANGKFSYVVVGMFFILSGATLYLTHQSIPSLKKFYYKRWLSLFPAFYLVFLILYLKNAILSHSLFYLGRPLTLLLSLIGMDGYLNYLIPNYYIIGEWFLGAIILVYLLYPLVLKLFQKNSMITYTLITVLMVLQSYTSFFTISPNRNLITCLFYLISGMIIMKYELYNQPIFNIGGGIISCLFLLITIPIPSNITCAMIGIGGFLGLSLIGRMIMNSRILNKLFIHFSSISYYTFLIQHRVILAILERIMVTTPIKVLGLLLFTTIITILLASLIKLVMKPIIKIIDTKCSKIAI